MTKYFFIENKEQYQTVKILNERKLELEYRKDPHLHRYRSRYKSMICQASYIPRQPLLTMSK